jgi:hypothetical protein
MRGAYGIQTCLQIGAFSSSRYHRGMHRMSADGRVLVLSEATAELVELALTDLGTTASRTPPTRFPYSGSVMTIPTPTNPLTGYRL